MPSFYACRINFTRNAVRHITDEHDRREQAKKHVRFFHVTRDAHDGIISEDVIPDEIVPDAMVDRYLSIEPPQMNVIPEFDPIIDEIERTYVLGLMFSATSAALVTTERLLNLLRIELHQFHPNTQQELQGQGPITNWKKNIDALVEWGYLKGEDFTERLRKLYRTRCKYLHAGPLAELDADAFTSVTMAYEFLNKFLGFPPELFNITNGIECKDPSHPLFITFYKPAIVTKDE